MQIITGNGVVDTRNFDSYEIIPVDGGSTQLTGVTYGDYKSRYAIATGPFEDLKNLMTEISVLKEQFGYDTVMQLDGFILSPVFVRRDALINFLGDGKSYTFPSLDAKLKDAYFGSFFEKQHFMWSGV